MQYKQWLSEWLTYYVKPTTKERTREKYRKTLSEILEHGDPTVPLKRYAHAMLEHKTEMTSRLVKLLLQ